MTEEKRDYMVHTGKDGEVEEFMHELTRSEAEKIYLENLSDGKKPVRIFHLYCKVFY